MKKQVIMPATMLVAALLATSCGGDLPGEYRNLAKWHAAYHSSAADFNLTAQLATDGIIEQGKHPATVNIHLQDKQLTQKEVSWLTDSIIYSNVTVQASDLKLQMDMDNMKHVADKMVLEGYVQVDLDKPQGYKLVTEASKDGKIWEVIDTQEKSTGYLGTGSGASGYWGYGNEKYLSTENSPVKFLYDYTPVPEHDAPARPRQESTVRSQNMRLNYIAAVDPTKGYTHYRINVKMPAGIGYQLVNWNFFNKEEWQPTLAMQQFTSAWKSETGKEEWLSVDFGAEAQYDKIAMYWLNAPAKGTLESSQDGKTWNKIIDLPEGMKADTLDLGKKVKSRYVRLNLTASANGQPYELSEIQVFGKGGTTTQLPAIALDQKPGCDMLNGTDWSLQRSSQVKAKGEEISKIGFDTSEWMPAAVPATILASMVDMGAVPNPDYDDNQVQVSESYYESDFWYRKEFQVKKHAGKTYLNLDGINWKAGLWLNGLAIGRVEGAFKRGKIDVTDLLQDGANVLAVRIEKNNHPGATHLQDALDADKNGGNLGTDNPTFHASIGWDWIPTIRGRNRGIWNDVYLSYSGDVTIEDPFVRTELPALPDTTKANVLVEVTLKNHSDKAVEGTLKGAYGETQFSQTVTLQPSEEKLVKMDPLSLTNPKLWWPVGYGEPYLYDVNLTFDVKGEKSDEKNFKSGVRQMDYDMSPYTQSGGLGRNPFGIKDDRRLTMYINGKRFIGFGGNWGFSESNLRYRAHEYDVAVALHADMHFTMIRNWVGMIGDEEFFEACDRHGVMIWQDFWLANPADGPNPAYNDMFKDNAYDFIRKIRNHPSLAIYVGRNEGNPPAILNDYLDNLVKEQHPGMNYIPHSAAYGVSGGGTYNVQSTKEYFQLWGHDKFHSERGMPNVMNYESLSEALRPEHMEPYSSMEHPNKYYGLHDYTLGDGCAQKAETFNALIKKMFGEPKDARQFTEWAQWINYDGYRAIFEARSEHRRGMLLWMSHPAWPSMVWQTYDYYFDPTGGYFGCKKACEPIHIQWNPIREDIEVVNYHAGDLKQLTAKAQLLNEDGTEAWSKEAVLDINTDETVACFPLDLKAPKTASYFIKLTLTNKDGKVISENFYTRGKEEGNLQSLTKLPKALLTQDLKATLKDGVWTIEGTLKNESKTPAMMIRLMAQGSKSQQRILPVIYQDNYFFLMPGESKTIHVTVQDSDAEGDKPELKITGFNL